MPSAVRRIDFVKEDYGWFVFASSLKQEFDQPCTFSNPLGYDIAGAYDVQSGLDCGCKDLGQGCLTSSRWPVKQNELTSLC